MHDLQMIRNFVTCYDITYSLFRHMQNCVMITYLEFGREQREISVDFELHMKNRYWVGPKGAYFTNSFSSQFHCDGNFFLL